MVVRNPLEYFMRMRVQEALYSIRPKPNRYYKDRDLVYEDEEEVDTKIDEWDRIQKYNERVKPKEISGDDNFDPLNYVRHAHNLSIFELKEGLMDAINARKATALPLAIKVFNKIQSKVVSMSSLEPETDEAGAVKSINESLEKADLLLNDSSSPLLSNLKALKKYATQKLPDSIDEYRSTIKNGDIIDEPVDLNVMINDYQALNNTEDHLKKMEDQFN